MSEQNPDLPQSVPVNTGVYSLSNSIYTNSARQNQSIVVSSGRQQKRADGTEPFDARDLSERFRSSKNRRIAANS